MCIYATSIHFIKTLDPQRYFRKNMYFLPHDISTLSQEFVNDKEQFPQNFRKNKLEMDDFNGGCKIFSFLSYHKLSKLAFSCLSDFYDDWLERMIDLKSGFHYRFIINVCLKGFHFLNVILCTSSSRELLKFKVSGYKIFNSKKEEKSAIFSI